MSMRGRLSCARSGYTYNCIILPLLAHATCTYILLPVDVVVPPAGGLYVLNVRQSTLSTSYMGCANVTIEACSSYLLASYYSPLPFMHYPATLTHPHKTCTGPQLAGRQPRGRRQQGQHRGRRCCRPGQRKRAAGLTREVPGIEGCFVSRWLESDCLSHKL